MMLFDAELMDDRPIVKVSKTQNLINKVADMQDVYSTGNTYKVAAGGLSIASTLGLMLGSLIGSPGLVGFLLFSSVGTALMAYLARVFEESTSLGAAPLFELYQGQDIGKSQLQGREQLHWQAIDALGDEMVEKVEDSGYLELLLDHVKHANLKLRGVDNDDYDRTYYALMQSVKSKFLPCLPPVPSIDRTSPTPRRRSLPTQQENPDIWEDSENQGSIDRYLTPAAVADTLPKIRDLPQEIATLKRHVLFVASTTSGKTTALTQVISHALGSGHQVTVLDGKGNLALKNSGAVYRHCNTPERAMDAIEILEKVVATMETRQDLALKGHTDFTPITIIIDELNLIRAFLKKVSKEALEAFSELIVHILLQGAASNIFLRLAAHTSRLPKLGLDGGEADSLSFVALGRNGSYESLEDCLDYQVNGRKSKKFQDELDGLIHESFRETLAFSTIAPMGFYRLPWVDQSPAAFAPKPELDIRSSLDRLYQSATAPEPTAIPETPPSKIDLLSDSDLESLLEKVLAYSRRKEKVRPSDITSGLRICRGYSAPEIMQLFNYLDEAGEGVVRANEFIPN